ncbi:MAG: M24 family metallopeptidase [Luteibaculaceae bacterium]
MNQTLLKLQEAEKKAEYLFQKIDDFGLIKAGKSEKDLNDEIYALAKNHLQIEKYWHKRIVRAGKNTLLPYQHNPENLVIQEDDILFLDFGPIFEGWEADFGRTYVIGSDENKIRLKKDVETLWKLGQDFYHQQKETLTAAEFYHFTAKEAEKMGWGFGHVHCGHLIGEFPHEKIAGDEIVNYIHKDNLVKLNELDKNGTRRFWIYEIHLVDSKNNIGGFFEQILDLE